MKLEQSKRYRWALTGIMCLAVCAQAQPLRVLHWWKSDSERMAADIIATKVRQAGFEWIEDDVGVAAASAIILRSRLLARDLPDIGQANSQTADQWRQLGLLTELDSVAAAGKWSERLLPSVEKMIKPAGYVVAAPLGVHRLNTMFYNHAIFQRLKLTPPRTWREFEAVAAKLKRAGVLPLAQSSEPWQLGVLFENVLLADGGVALHNSLFLNASGRGRASAYTDPAMAATLRHFRSLKKWMRHPLREQEWPHIVRQLADGSAAMTISGDWAKGELNAWGLATGQLFGCMASPDTTGMHLYNLDTLAMLVTQRPVRAAQEKVAAIAITPELQERYNRLKGSVPVLRHPNLAAMDSCARASWTLLALPGATLVASTSIGTVGDALMRDALVAELHRFFMDDTISVRETQRRLATLSHAYTEVGLRRD